MALNYQCPTEFYVSTSLVDCTGIKKKMKESTDVLKYRFDIKPKPMCFMQGQFFQGNQMVGARSVPPGLMDAELALRTMPLLEQENEYIVDEPLHKAKPPKMPAVLANRMVIPDCDDILQTNQRTKVKHRWDQAGWDQRIEKTGRPYFDYMRPGRDSRQEIRDLYKKWEEQQAAKLDVYGVGKFDKRPLKPGTNPKCAAGDTELDCMHVYGPDAERTADVIDPTLSLKVLSRQSDGVLPPSAGAASVGSAGVDPVTRQIASTIDPKKTLNQLIQEQQAKGGCNVRFYDWQRKC